MVLMYGIPNCNTVKKAKDWLLENQIEFQFHDYKRLGVTNEKLNDWLVTLGSEKILNKVGLTFKKLSAEQKEKLIDNQSIADYLRQNTSAIKRPIIERDGQVILIGFNEAEYQSFFKK